MLYLTQILNALRSGRTCSEEELLPVIYQELRQMAARHMAQQPPGHTLQATALVHEAYLKLMRNNGQPWENRRHFFGAAARAMSQILVDIARRKSASKHSGPRATFSLDLAEIPGSSAPEQFIELHHALDQLTQEDPAEAEIVRLRYFVGLSNAEVAELLGLSLRSVERHWSFAKAWLFQAMKSGRAGFTAPDSKPDPLEETERSTMLSKTSSTAD